MTNHIDSLPATSVWFGMPGKWDRVWCHKCKSEQPDDCGTTRDCDNVVYCFFCRSYDVEKVKP